MSEQNIENVEGDVNVQAEAAPDAPASGEAPAEKTEAPEADTNGDDAQQDTGALQE